MFCDICDGFNDAVYFDQENQNVFYCIECAEDADLVEDLTLIYSMDEWYCPNCAEVTFEYDNHCLLCDSRVIPIMA